MIRAKLDGNRIMVLADAEDASTVRALPGVIRGGKMPPLTWHMPLITESIELLRGVRVRASPELVAEVKRLLTAQRYVEAQKQPGTAVPLRPIPVMPGTQLYDHQIKAYNIVLALYGYAPSQGGDDQ